jgi:hypothetical protein
MRCHTRNLRPNWESYDNWPGAYFGHDDSRNDPEAEKEFPNFLKAAKNHPRYRHLVELEEGYGPSKGRIGDKGTAVQHNINFTFLVWHLNYRRLAKIIKESPDSQAFRFAVIGAVHGCEGSKDREWSRKTHSWEELPPIRIEEFLPEELRKEFRASFEATKKIDGRPEGIEKSSPFLSVMSSKYGVDDDIAALKALFRMRNVSTEGWFLNFLGKEEFGSPGSPRPEFTAFLIHGDPELESLFELREGDLETLPKAVKKEVNPRKFCLELKAKSEAAFKKWTPSSGQSKESSRKTSH